ncbi:hypothetical protein ACFOD4_13210 [Pseudoroseomonas globiformis]|uniref:Chemotaxis methyl-accepting receptor HlyB-like 4HB MCP domain-containing protein n=1 Tax=Teichococcus globiformis TaxID=2307229 RepID=A0ABV7G3E0_9PROT
MGVTNLKIVQRIGLGFGALLPVTAMAAAFGYAQLGDATLARQAHDELSGAATRLREAAAQLSTAAPWGAATRTEAQLGASQAAFDEEVKRTQALTTTVDSQLNPTGARLHELLGAASSSNADSQNTSGRELTAANENARWLLLMLSTAAVLPGGVVAWAIGRSITHPVVYMTGTMQILEAGNTGCRCQPWSVVTS